MATGEDKSSVKENLFSAGYRSETPESWGEHIEAAFAELGRITNDKVRCVRWNDKQVAAAFEIRVDLPSRGTFRDIDIRSREPVLLVFNKRDYPEKSPMVRSDRKDFPVSCLPHLNPVNRDQPPWLCLHRGNFDDWFAEHTLEDLIRRVRNWYRDAAANRLIPEGDYFEPTRLIDTIGTTVFAPDSFEQWVKQGWKQSGGQSGYGFLFMMLLDPSKRDPARDGAFPVRARSFHPKDKDLRELLKVVHEYNVISRENPNLAPWCFGLLCWPPRQKNLNEYIGTLPQNASELFEMCRRLELPLEGALMDCASRELALLNGLPVILALPRPRPLINSALTIEPLCFVVDASDANFNGSGIIPDESRVFITGHRSPLTPRSAREISGFDEENKLGRILLFGCGALGSKIALHFGRSGHTAFTVVDHDTLSPHNFVRFALLSDRTGQNKAEALEKSISALFESIPEPEKPKAHTGSALDWLRGEQAADLPGHGLLLDATASGMVLEALIRAELPANLKVARCGIADLGRIGILAIEGPNRNPRVDDLNVLVYDMAIDNEPLQRWLARERRQREERVGPSLEEISIGLSCASDTMRLSDEVASWHASTFSLALRNLASQARKWNSGYLVLNFREGAEETAADISLFTESAPIDPVVILPTSEVKGGRARRTGRWQVRIHARAVAEMRKQLKDASPQETGGLMIGVIHPKRLTIYVTRIIAAPPDSHGSAFSFRRGTRRLPQAVSDIKKASGDLLGFVGDWHSHPRGSGRISETDIEAMLETKRDFDTAGLPTFILIATPNNLYAYIAEPE